MSTQRSGVGLPHSAESVIIILAVVLYMAEVLLMDA